jgi:transposase
MKERTILCVDYHDENCVVRHYDGATCHESVQQVRTDAAVLSSLVAQARRRQPNARVEWIQESTTGWARVKTLLGKQIDGFLLANTLSLPKRPKDHRRKTDKIDTARILHEYLIGRLGLADQPAPELREARRLVSYRENLVSRKTSIKNWISRYLAHETWEDRNGLWTVRGRRRFEKFIAQRCASDQLVLRGKLDEMDAIDAQLAKVIVALQELYQQWPAAQRLDAIKGISVVSAVSIVARIGSIERFPTAEHLIGYAGLNPGVQQSDSKRRDGHLGGGGTDRHLRHYLVEASMWARQLPRYHPVYERVLKRRGKRIARLQVCRMMLRSIDKILRDGIDFKPSLDVPQPA